MKEKKIKDRDFDGIPDVKDCRPYDPAQAHLLGSKERHERKLKYLEKQRAKLEKDVKKQEELKEKRDKIEDLKKRYYKATGHEKQTLGQKIGKAARKYGTELYKTLDTKPKRKKTTKKKKSTKKKRTSTQRPQYIIRGGVAYPVAKTSTPKKRKSLKKKKNK